MHINANRNKWLTRAGGAVLLLVLLALPIAGAAQAGSGITLADDGFIAQGEVVDNDLFISGEKVQVDGDVNGDVFATGQEVVINGNVAGNVFLAGQILEVNGVVDGSVYGAGYSLKIGPTSQVSGNIYSAGFSFESTAGSVVDRNLYSVGYQAILNGNVGRDALFSGAALQLNGNVGRDLTVEISESSDTSDAPDFYMPGEVEVIEPGYVKSAQATVGGEIDYQVTQYDTGTSGEEVVAATAADAVRARIGEFVALFIVGAVLLNAWPSQTHRVEEQIQKQPLQSLGWGLALVILFPVVLILAIVVVIMLAILLGIITLGELVTTVLGFGAIGITILSVVFGFVLWMASKAIFGHLVGEKLFDRFSPSTLDSRWGALLALALGVLIYEVVRSIWILGAVVAFFVVLIGLGAVAVVWRSQSAKPLPAKRKTRKTTR
jgi:cytoskeletal protein CcmA (bactofilin family)